MIVTIHGTAIELTEALKAYVHEKVTSLEKFFGGITKVEVDIGMRNHHHHKGDVFYAEMNVHVPGELIRVERDAEDLYKAIDKVKDHLKVELENADEKRRTKDKKAIRKSKEYQD